MSVDHTVGQTARAGIALALARCRHPCRSRTSQTRSSLDPQRRGTRARDEIAISRQVGLKPKAMVVAENGNNVEATFDFVERIVRLVAVDNTASTLSLVWTVL